MVLHPDPVTEHGAAGRRRRRVDGEDADLLARRPDEADQPGGERRLPRARRAGDADRVGVTAPYVRQPTDRTGVLAPSLDQRDQPGQGAAIALSGRGDQMIGVTGAGHRGGSLPGL